MKVKVRPFKSLVLALLLVLTVSLSSWAAFVNPSTLTDPYYVLEDNTPFYVFDIYGAGTGANNGSSSLTTTYFGNSGVVQYSFDGTNWFSLTNGGTTNVPTGITGYELIYVRDLNNGVASMSTNLIFQGWEIGSIFYNGILVSFANGNGAFISPQNNDNLSPYQKTPIPGAIWLLGTGLFGLVAIRRRKKS